MHMIKSNMQQDHRTFECTHIGITWLKKCGGGGGKSTMVIRNFNL